MTVGERIEAANESDQTGGLALPSHHGDGEFRRGDGEKLRGDRCGKTCLRALWALYDTIRGIAEGWARKQPESVWTRLSTPDDGGRQERLTTDESWTLADQPRARPSKPLEVRYERDDPISGQRTGRKTWTKSLRTQGGDLIIIAGRPSMGKTAIAMNIAGHTSEERKPVVVFSLEMGRQQLAGPDAGVRWAD